MLKATFKVKLQLERQEEVNLMWHCELFTILYTVTNWIYILANQQSYTTLAIDVCKINLMGTWTFLRDLHKGTQITSYSVIIWFCKFYNSRLSLKSFYYYFFFLVDSLSIIIFCFSKIKNIILLSWSILIKSQRRINYYICQ